MILETKDDLEKLKHIGSIVADTLAYMKKKACVGMTTKELDDIGGEYLKQHRARSAPILTYNFPGYTCISVNHHIAHGIPSEKILKSGDLVNIDVSAELDGYFADTGGSFLLDSDKPFYEKLCTATIEAMYAGISAAQHGAKISAIGKAIEKIARKHKFSIIENLGSHGVGRALHEEPKYIPSIFDAKDQRILKKGMVITVEPFLATGDKYANQEDDGWTLSVRTKHRAAQFEHTIVITEEEPIILTQPSFGKFF